MISYNEADRLILKNIAPLPAETIHLAAALRRVTAVDLTARLDSPSADVSLKDGFAVLRGLRHITRLACKLWGNPWGGQTSTREAVRILSGANLPAGADCRYRR